MKRDGFNKSIWQEVVLPKINNQDLADYEVVIVGAGITGLSTAVRLIEAGYSCLLLDANSIGFGTTSGTSAHLNTVLDTPYSTIIDQHGLQKAKLVLQSAREAIQLIEQNVLRYNIDCDFTRSAGYMYAQGEKESQELLKIEESIRKVGISCERVTSMPVPDKFDYAIRFEEQGHFHPVHYLAGLREAFISHGGVIREQTIVDHIDESEGKLTVVTGTGSKLNAKRVVYATHTPPGVQRMTFRLAPYRSYIQVWELSDPRQIMADVVYDMKEPFRYIRFVRQNEKQYLLIGGQDHRTAAQENEQMNFLELEAHVKNVYSVKKKVYQWSSQYYESQDSLPFIGLYPGFSSKKVYLATGYGGNGMIFGTLSSKIIADLICSRDNAYQELYAPARFGPISSIKELVSHNFEVAKHFLADRFTIEKVQGMVELAPGDGRVLKYDGQKMGVYKDLEGNIHIIEPTCPHAACTVKWNNAEHSWDCPCHGARYSFDGKILNGPTVNDLSKGEL